MTCKLKLEPGDKIKWGVGRSGTVQNVDGDNITILDNGWPASLWRDGSVCSVYTPPFIVVLQQSILANIRKRQ